LRFHRDDEIGKAIYLEENRHSAAHEREGLGMKARHKVLQYEGFIGYAGSKTAPKRGGAG
jgi:hypothetical protein